MLWGSPTVTICLLIVGMALAAPPKATVDPFTGKPLNRKKEPRAEHVRLCGDLVENLIDWSTCPGRNWHPAHAASMSNGNGIEYTTMGETP